MLLDYIPVYYPETNQWSIPNREIEKYEDYIASPQEMTLFEGAVIRGTPLIHFGTWGALGVNITEVVRGLAKDPVGFAKKSYKHKKTAADVAAFFKTLVGKYPNLVEVTEYRESRESGDLCVPAGCVVSRPKGKRK